MKESAKLAKAFERLAKKYPAAAKELAKEFAAAIGVAAAKAKIAAESREQTAIITVEGRGPDGKLYRAEFDAIFPRGTQILSVTTK